MFLHFLREQFYKSEDDGKPETKAKKDDAAPCAEKQLLSFPP
jgi:hypothetical protein